jgi:hypothetical protein
MLVSRERIMKTVWKYQTHLEGYLEINLPMGAEILAVQRQGKRKEDEVFIWCLVDTDKPTETRKFKFYGTGEDLDAESLKYIGTLQFFDGENVIHLFELL